MFHHEGHEVHEEEKRALPFVPFLFFVVKINLAKMEAVTGKSDMGIINNKRTFNH